MGRKESNQNHHVPWIPGSIPGFSSLSDDTFKIWPYLHVGGTLNTSTHTVNLW